jgi:hypothetical protein
MDTINHNINIIDPDAFEKALSDMNCGRAKFGEISADIFEIPFYEAKPIEGYLEPDNFPRCCNYHQSICESLEKWFEDFPNCCEDHKKLLQTHWFKKENYKTVALKVVRQLCYTGHHIKCQIDKPNWLEEITNYIDYNVTSFGQLPLGYGAPVGLNNYLENLRDEVKKMRDQDENISVDKVNRIIEFINTYYAPKNNVKIDLNILDTTYRNWLKIFPFNISYFRELKKYYETQFPILKGKPSYNKYTGLTKVKIQTQSELIESLTNLTKELLQKITSKGTQIVDDSKLHLLELTSENHRIKQLSLLGVFTKGESEYVGILRTWLSNEKFFFKEIISLMTNDQLDHQRPSTKLQLAPIANEDLFEDFVCDLYNSIDIKARFHRFGKRGNNQKGIDLISTTNGEAIQCKKKDISRKGLINELKCDFESDIQSAMQLGVEINLLIFASTFHDNAQLSEHLQGLKTKYNPKFNLMYVGWDSLSSLAQDHHRIMNKYFPSPPLKDDNQLDTFFKFIPTTYLNNLPRIKYNSYIEAHKLWDTGITAKMLGGNSLLSDRLKKILIELAEMAYLPKYFANKSALEFYEERITKMMSAAYDAQPIDAGTMHVVMASGQMAEIINDYIVQIVRDVTDSSYYKSWKERWDKATKAGQEGKEIDLNLNDEF